MSKDDFLKDPLSLFSVKGKTAIVTGATGAFGAVAAKTLAAAGANVVICASNAEGLNKVSKIVDQKPEDFLVVMDANVTQSWLMSRACVLQMLKQGRGGKIVLMSSARG